jgi:hypothetical protein
VGNAALAGAAAVQSGTSNRFPNLLQEVNGADAPRSVRGQLCIALDHGVENFFMILKRARVKRRLTPVDTRLLTNEIPVDGDTRYLSVSFS